MKLASPFGDHMVLQHGMPAPLWGTDAPGTPVSAELCGQTLTTRADEHGAWRVTVAPLAPGGPFTLRVRGSSDVVLRDVLIGDVWLCSGQSNMEWPLQQTAGADDELRRADIPRLRLATVPKTPADTPQRDTAMSWSVCSASSAKLFSAVAYHFGKILHQQLDIPIGLINCSWGGSCAEAWMPLDVLERDPRHRPIVERYRTQHHGDISAVFKSWTNTPAFHQDTGNEGEARGWALPACDTCAWRALPMPSYWQQHGWNFNGAVWLRREVDIPKS